MDVYSLWKQLTRYNNWYSELADLGKLQDVVGSVVKAFPIGMEEVGV